MRGGIWGDLGSPGAVQEGFWWILDDLGGIWGRFGVDYGVLGWISGILGQILLVLWVVFYYF